MHRSASASRVSDELSAQPPPSLPVHSSRPSSDHLPTYNPLSQAAKRERSRLRSAEIAVHLIPLVLLLCALILWFFSTPGKFKLRAS
ncbi:uncharacterized protein LOC131164555 isoform X2 [Malania oleifera]|uniref:uncharacterized protein LOC131164555 isoform X2 n=1 Tax=Malania oleifera TaxID=397392 RepID=UPI0025AE21B4|nr:uncharacterized protein LOC131164555 isoform X2 [Malania oleifera]